MSAAGVPVANAATGGVAQKPSPYVSHGRTQPNWKKPEIKLLDRFARLIGDGRYRSLPEAVPDCHKALVALRQADPALPPRPADAVRRRLTRQCRVLGLRRRMSHWSKAEDDLALECAVEFVAGRFPTMRDAARECKTRLAAISTRDCGMDSIYWHMARHVRAIGVPAYEQEWTAREMKILESHVRMLHCGRPVTLTQMSEVCSRALGGKRSPEAVRSQLIPILDRLALPRYHSFSAPFEVELIERYAREVKTDAKSAWRVAARSCHKALEKEHRRRALAAGADPYYGRTPNRTFVAMLRTGRRLGLHTPRDQRRWSEEESRMCESWRRWYTSHRHWRRHQPLTTAAYGPIDDLEAKGYRRTLGACRTRLGGYTETWREAHGWQPKPRLARSA